MSSWKYDLSRKNAEFKVSIEGQKNVKKMKILEKNWYFYVSFNIFGDIWYMWIKKIWLRLKVFRKLKKYWARRGYVNFCAWSSRRVTRLTVYPGDRSRGGKNLIFLRVKKNQLLSFDMWSRAEAFWGFGIYIEVYFLKVWILKIWFE